MGSLTELGELAGRDVTDVDPHRPAIDEVVVRVSPSAASTARRVPEVIDTWYDSGAMPFAQWGYHPELGRGIEEFERSFPADFISEAIDQTRGWFYTLMAEGVLHFDSTAYRNVRLPRDTSSPPTAGRCRSRSATCSTRGKPSTARAPTRCAGS